jgi:hypothetical protein
MRLESTMVPFTGHRPRPLADVRQQSRAAVLVGLGLRLVLGAAVVGVLAGVVESALWEPVARADERADACLDAPCPPESLPDLRQLPLLVPPLGYLLASVLGVSALLLSLLSGGRWRSRRRVLLPVLGPVAVFVALEVVPHIVNPCLVADALGDSLPVGCASTVHGVDVHDRWHALHHAVVGGLPAAVGYAALLRRRRPELFAASDADPAEVGAGGVRSGTANTPR